MSARDDFTKKTVDTLAKRAGGKCSICKCPTYGPNDNPYVATNIGQAAHISAAAEGGPRYDPAMTPEVRKSLKNALWLCSNCHDVIDRNPQRYPVKKLHEIKKEAENRARELLGVPAQSVKRGIKGDDQLAAAISAIAVVEIRKARASLHSHSNQASNMQDTTAWETLSKIEYIDFNTQDYLSVVGSEVIQLLFHLVGYKHAPEVYLEIIRHIKDTVEAFVSEWSREEVQRVCEVLKVMMERQSTVRNSVYQSALALLKDMVKLAKALNNRIVSDVINDYFQGAIKKRLQSIQDRDETDSYEELPPAKRGCGIEHDDQVALQYLEKMLELGKLATPTISTTEKDIVDLGFEPNII